MPDQQDEPHYIIAPTVSNWRSEAFPTRAAAQHWLDCYQVSAEYKERTYKLISVRAYWKERGL